MNLDQNSQWYEVREVYRGPDGKDALSSSPVTMVGAGTQLSDGLASSLREKMVGLHPTRRWVKVLIVNRLTAVEGGA